LSLPSSVPRLSHHCLCPLPAPVLPRPDCPPRLSLVLAHRPALVLIEARLSLCVLVGVPAPAARCPPLALSPACGP
jgi:hypothetical protein